MKKEQFFTESQDKIFEIARKGGQGLAVLLKKLLGKMETENGTIKNSLKNRKILSEVLKLIRTYYKSQTSTLSKEIETRLSELVGINIEEFEKQVKKKIDKQLYTDTILTDIGFIGSKIKPNSYLDSLLKDNVVSKTIVATISKAIKAGSALADLVKKITEYFVPKSGLGLIESQLFRNGGYNLYQQQDRILTDTMAEDLNLNYAVYSHTVKNNTRHFCKQRINKIYTREEIKSWNALQWSGKNQNIDVLFSQGGHNCRGSYSWISEETAKRLASTRGGVNSYHKV